MATNQPLPPPVRRSPAVAPDAPSTELHPPQKFKRPLPQPGDKDYVVGQPVDEEEASRVEREDEERYEHGQALVKEAQARRQDDKDSKR
jgi:hypothetical protein